MKKYISLLLAFLLVITTSMAYAFADGSGDEPVIDNPAASEPPVTEPPASEPPVPEPPVSEPPVAEPPVTEFAPPEFVGGGGLYPVSDIESSMNIGDSILFEVDSQNFSNIESFGSADASGLVSSLSVELYGDANCFAIGRVQVVNGSARFELVAVSPCAESRTFSVCVSDSNGASTLSYPFITTVLQPQTEGPDSQQGENSESTETSQPESQAPSSEEQSERQEEQSSEGEPPATDTSPALISGFMDDSPAPVISHHADTISIGDEILVAISDDSFTWIGGTGEKIYDLTALNSWKSQKVVAPANFASEFVTDSGNLNLKLTAIAAGSIIAQPVGFVDGDKALLSVVIVDPDDEDGNGIADSADSDALLDDENGASTDLFTPRSMTLAMFSPVTPMATAIVDEINGINTVNPSKWGIYSGFPTAEPAIVASNAALTFSIPDNNFTVDSSSQKNISENLGILNDPAKSYLSSIKIEYTTTAGVNDAIVQGYFEPEFIQIGSSGSESFGLQLTPKNIPAGGLILPAGTTFGFSGVSSSYLYSLEAPLYIGTKISGTVASPPAWLPIGVVPSGNVPATTTLLFEIPLTSFNGNFLDQTGAAALAGNVEIINGGTTTDLASSFDVSIVYDYDPAYAPPYIIGAIITPVTGIHPALNAGTTIGFKNGAKYTLASELSFGSQDVPDKSTKVTGLASGSYLGDSNTYMTKNGNACTESLDSLECSPGDEYLIYFRPGFFEWDNGVPSTVLLSQIPSKIAFKTSNSSNSSVIDTISLTSHSGVAVVKILFKSPLILKKDTNFKIKSYFTVSSSRVTSSEIDIAGTISNGDPTEFYADDTDIDLSDGVVGLAVDAIKNLQVYLGEGVYVNVKNMRKNAKFYGVAVLDEESSSDEDILEKYPDIVNVYTLYTVGLNGAGNTVEFDTDSTYYVYDSNLNYLGRSGQKLPYSQKYYFSVSELNVSSASDPTGDPTAAPPGTAPDPSAGFGSDAGAGDPGLAGLPGGVGGDASTGASGNFNPPTGWYPED